MEIIFGNPGDRLGLNGRTGAYGEIADLEDLPKNQGSSRSDFVIEDEASHRSFYRQHGGTLNESTNVGVKTGRSWVGGLELCV